MANIRTLLDGLIRAEQGIRETTFLAPALRGGRIRTRMQGLIYEFVPESATFEGWGIFRPQDGRRADLVEEASPYLIDEYLRLFPALRLRLSCKMENATWLACPVNSSEAWRRFDLRGPVPVHLVGDASPMEQVIGRWDGTSVWFQEVDRRGDPIRAEQLRELVKRGEYPDRNFLKGLTPEEKESIRIALGNSPEGRIHRNGEAAIRFALRRGGGELVRAEERNDRWLVEWRTSDGDGYTSAVAKNDLTVIGAGICLSGEDRKFDLQSLVGVMERRPEWMR